MINIIGGGPAGLFTAYNLLKRGIDAKVYEKDLELGFPLHCTGIVSNKTIKLFEESKEITINKLYGVKVIVGDRIYKALSSTPKAFMIDRVRFENNLGHKILDLGGEIILGKKYDYKTYRNNLPPAINASGVASYIIFNIGRTLPALQIDLKVGNEKGGIEIEEGIAYLWIDKNINPDYFFWILNTGKYIRIGTASKKFLRKRIYEVIEKNFKNYTVLDRYFGLIILDGPMKKFYNKTLNMIYIGDSAGQVKPTTGGGLYYIGIASKILAKLLSENQYEYSNYFYKELGKEIMYQKLLRKIFEESSNDDIIDILDILSKKEIFEILLNYGDMDYHANTLINILDYDVIKLVFGRKFLWKIIRSYLTL